MKTFFSLIFCIAASLTAFAQDRILTLTGEEIVCKVKEIDSSEIRYLTASTDSATKAISYGTTLQHIKITEVFLIKYENGTKDVFTQNLPGEKTIAAVAPQASATDAAQMFALGRQDAATKYKGTTPFLVGGLCGITFGYGFVPAVVVAAIPPKPSVQTASDPSLIYNPSYTEGFKTKAHGRKALNVAAGFGAGLLIDIVIVIALSSIL